MLAIGVSMHKVKEILRLYFDAKLSQHQIAASLNLSSGVVNKYLALAKAAQLIWPLPQEMDEVALRRL
jgi:DNA-binding transcriptional regulator LsrR (DeoR family)